MITPELVPLEEGLLCVSHNEETGEITVYEELMPWDDYIALQRRFAEKPAE